MRLVHMEEIVGLSRFFLPRILNRNKLLFERLDFDGECVCLEGLIESIFVYLNV